MRGRRGHPNDGGRCRQAQPLVNTNTTAVNTARSSIAAVPPPCGRGGNGGTNGAASSHNPSGTNFSAKSSLMRPTMQHQTHQPHETRSKC